MNKTDEVGARSLEDILASIRKSLSDETVDGLVELSAAAAAAARAETRTGSPSAPGASTAAGPTTDALSDKLAGALSAAEPEPDDLDDLLAHGAGTTNVSLRGPALRIDEPDAPSAESRAAVDAMWVLRPGAPEAATAPRAAAELKLEVGPRDVAGTANGSTAGAKLAPPRLDSEKISLINKLRISSARPVAPEAKVDPLLVVTPSVENAAREAGSEPVHATNVKEQPAEINGAATPATPILRDVDRSLFGRPDAVRASLPPLFGAAADERRPATAVPFARAPEPDAEPEPEPELDPELPTVETVAEPALAEEEATAAPEAEPAAEPEVQQPEPEAEPDTMAVDPDMASILAMPATHGLLTPPKVVETAAQAEPEPDLPPFALVGTQAAANRAQLPPLPAGPKAPTLEDMIASALEPVLQKLIEKNLAPIVESIVRREVERVLRDRGSV